METQKFLTNPTPANNQVLQELFADFATFFKAYQVPDYTLYAGLLSDKIQNTLKSSLVLMGKLTHLYNNSIGNWLIF
ncbi:hypothetical protein [Bacillus mycoides]|uniref:hypothetical protein n=1 Tax=Bacillus mycoides TaxID=1405 RepID=UPI00211367CF|nr:hypothetical protein [Bacillus mycoides]MCQ6530971.1 hypothetical protein [Bacillus mycoides]